MTGSFNRSKVDNNRKVLEVDIRCTIERTANSTGGSWLVHLIGKPAVTVDTNRCVVNTLPNVEGCIYCATSFACINTQENHLLAGDANSMATKLCCQWAHAG